MDVAILEARVQRLIQGDVLTLDAKANALGSASINALVDTYFGGTLTGSVQRLGGKNTLVQGQKVICFLSLDAARFTLCPSEKPLMITLDFLPREPGPNSPPDPGGPGDPGAIQLDIAVTLPEGYGFADSFGVLKDRPGLPINQLVLAGSTLTLSSANKSLRLDAGLEVAGPLAVLSRLTGSSEPLDALRLHGEIGVQRTGDDIIPIFELETPSTFSCKLGTGYSVQVSVRVRSEIDPATSVLVSRVELATKFRPAKLTLPVVVPLYGSGQHLLSFQLDRSQPVPALGALKDLEGYTGGENLAKRLELCPDLHKANLSLNHVSAVVDPEARQIVSLRLQVDLGLSWTILKGVLELEGLGAALTVQYPGIAGMGTTHASFFGRLKLGKNTHLEAGVQLPEGDLHASLADSSVIYIGEMMATLAKGLALPGGTDDSGDGLKIHRLEVFGRVAKGAASYSLEAATSGSLEVYPGATVDDLSLFVAYENGELSEAQISGGMAWGPISAAVSMTAVH